MTRTSRLKAAIDIASVLATGLVSGIMVGTGCTLYAARTLPEKSWTLSFQVDDVIFAKTMIPLFIFALVALSASSLRSASNARRAHIAGLAFFLLAVGVTLSRNVPINMQVRSWTAGSAPASWAALRDRWLWSHLVRSIAALASFVCAVTGLTLASLRSCSTAGER